MKIIILADKYQKRMKSRGCVGLIKLQNKNILYHQYKLLKSKFPKADIIYVYGFDNKKLLSYIDKNENLYHDMVLVYNKRYEKYNNSFSLSLLDQYLDDDILLLFGDQTLSSINFNKFDPSNGSQVFIDNKSKSKLGCIIQKNKIENICYDLDNKLSEVYFICKDHSSSLRNLVYNPLYHNYFVFELINKMIDSNKIFTPYFTNKKISNAI